MSRPGKTFLVLTLATAGATAAYAQSPSSPAPATSNQPVSFIADQISYDKSNNIVTATGHVHAVQNGQNLYADKVVLNRNTNVAVATGHVTLIQPGGDIIFANDATLSKGMKNAIMEGVSTRLALNARLIANGGRRYDGKVDELAKVVYSACDLCKSDPTAPPTWQIRASTVTRDLEHKRIEYRDAEMEFYGFPVFYTPYLTQPDPSVKRQSGFLIPGIGTSSRIGFFAVAPYYYVINQQSDITLTPIISSKKDPALKLDYRRVFNKGALNIKASLGNDTRGFGNAVFANGIFDLDQNWRAGFNYDHASNPNYLNDFSILPNVSYLTSNVFLEGFSSGSYARIDAETFQGLVASISQSTLPIVFPYAQYHFVSDQDRFGGQYSVDTSAFNIQRNVGTNARRIAAEPAYSVPVSLPFGVVGTTRIQLITAGYDSNRLYQQPNFSTINSANTARVQPFGALFLRLPFIRSAGSLGTQLIEPQVQFVASPNIGISQNNRIPNEDSLDLEYSDANLFSLNRYPGIDRIEGGSRVDYAMHSAWYFPQGTVIDGLFGQSYRFHKDADYLPGSGLTDNVSDYVGRLIISPTPLFNIVYRTRLSHADFGARMIDATANFGTPKLNFSTGYFYENTNPYVLYTSAPTNAVTLNPPSGYFTPRREITLNAASNLGAWTLNAGVTRNLQTGRFDSASFSGGWQNDCFGISFIYNQRFNSFNLDHGNTVALIQLTFKTLGNVGFNAL